MGLYGQKNTQTTVNNKLECVFSFCSSILRLNRKKTVYLSKTDLHIFEIGNNRTESARVGAFSDINRREDLKQEVNVFCFLTLFLYD